MARYGHITPILRVEDMKRSLDFYVGQLGFRNAEWGDDDFTAVHREDAGLMLCRGGQGNPGTWVYAGVNNARELHDEFVQRGLAHVGDLTNRPWALEFTLRDPDGHVIRFGSEPEG